jgi:hypothetical protein
MYVVGAPAHLTATFTDSTGTLVDPTAVTVAITKPDGTAAAGSPFTAVRDSLGKYHYDYTTTVAGIHQYYFAGTGAVIATQLSDVFTVAPTATTAIISLGDAKEALNKVGATVDDAEILLMVRAATEVINGLADYTAATTVTEIVDSTVDRYGRGVIVLSHAPVMTVQTITPVITGTAIVTVNQANLDVQAGIYYLGTGSSFWGPQKAAYTAGRVLASAALQEACRLEVQYLWLTQSGGASIGFAGQETEPTMDNLPVRVLQLVRDAGNRRIAGVA